MLAESETLDLNALGDELDNILNTPLDGASVAREDPLIVHLPNDEPDARIPASARVDVEPPITMSSEKSPEPGNFSESVQSFQNIQNKDGGTFSRRSYN